MPKQSNTIEFKELAVKRIKASQSGSTFYMELGLSAPAASGFNYLKSDRVHGFHYETHAEIKAAAFEYIELFYKRKRQNSAVGYRPPAQFLENWIREQHQEKLVV